MKPLNVIDLGRRPYLEVLELQRTLCRDRAEGVVSDDLLLLVEHEPVITLGRSTAASSLPVPREQIVARGIEVHEVERLQRGNSCQKRVRTKGTPPLTEASTQQAIGVLGKERCGRG